MRHVEGHTTYQLRQRSSLLDMYDTGGNFQIDLADYSPLIVKDNTQITDLELIFKWLFFPQTEEYLDFSKNRSQLLFSIFNWRTAVDKVAGV